MINFSFWVWTYRGDVWVSLTKPEFTNCNRETTFEGWNELCLWPHREWMGIPLELWGLKELPPDGVAWKIELSADPKCQKAGELTCSSTYPKT